MNAFHPMIYNNGDFPNKYDLFSMGPKVERKIFEKDVNVHNGRSPDQVFYNAVMNPKRQKLSNHEYVGTGHSENKKPAKSMDLYSIFLADILNNEEQCSVKSTNLIKGYVKAIFRFALYELNRDKEKDIEKYKNFKEFSEKHYERIANISNLQWIWTVNENDPVEVKDSKVMFRSMSKRFLEDDNLINKWIDSSKIKEANKKAYIDKKAIFVRGLEKPETLTNLTVI